MRYHFHENNLITGYIKELLTNFNLPVFEVYKPGVTKVYGNTHYILDRDLILTNSDLADGTDGLSALPVSGYKYVTAFGYNQAELNITKHLKLNSILYDSYTHEYLGDFLRFYRDYTGVDLMMLYNCFSDRILTNLKYNTFDSADSNHKIYALPVKFNKKYLIGIESALPVEVACGLYRDNNQITTLELTDLFQRTYKCFNTMSFMKPVEYSTFMPVSRKLKDYEPCLKMYIKVPADLRSSISVVEIDAASTRFQQHVDGTVPDIALPEDRFMVEYPSKLSLFKLNDGTSYPFADRLVEYLLGNAITSEEIIGDNIGRVQEQLLSNQQLIQNGTMLHNYKHYGVWSDEIRLACYEAANHKKNDGSLTVVRTASTSATVESSSTVALGNSLQTLEAFTYEGITTQERSKNLFTTANGTLVNSATFVSSSRIRLDWDSSSALGLTPGKAYVKVSGCSPLKAYTFSGVVEPYDFAGKDRFFVYCYFYGRNSDSESFQLINAITDKIDIMPNLPVTQYVSFLLQGYSEYQITFYAGKQYAASSTAAALWSQLQVELGSVKTSFEPYAAVPTPEDPRSIQSTTGTCEMTINNTVSINSTTRLLTPMHNLLEQQGQDISLTSVTALARPTWFELPLRLLGQTVTLYTQVENVGNNRGKMELIFAQVSEPGDFGYVSVSNSQVISGSTVTASSTSATVTLPASLPANTNSLLVLAQPMQTGSGTVASGQETIFKDPHVSYSVDGLSTETYQIDFGDLVLRGVDDGHRDWITYQDDQWVLQTHTQEWNPLQLDAENGDYVRANGQYVVLYHKRSEAMSTDTAFCNILLPRNVRDDLPEYIDLQTVDGEKYVAVRLLVSRFVTNPASYSSITSAPSTDPCAFRAYKTALTFNETVRTFTNTVIESAGAGTVIHPAVANLSLSAGTYSFNAVLGVPTYSRGRVKVIVNGVTLEGNQVVANTSSVTGVSTCEFVLNSTSNVALQVELIAGSAGVLPKALSISSSSLKRGTETITTEEISTAIINEWLAEAPCQVIVGTEEEVTTPITDTSLIEQLDEIKALLPSLVGPYITIALDGSMAISVKAEVYTTTETTNSIKFINSHLDITGYIDKDIEQLITVVAK